MVSVWHVGRVDQEDPHRRALVARDAGHAALHLGDALADAEAMRQARLQAGHGGALPPLPPQTRPERPAVRALRGAGVPRGPPGTGGAVWQALAAAAHVRTPGRPSPR